MKLLINWEMKLKKLKASLIKKEAFFLKLIAKLFCQRIVLQFYIR